MNFFDAQLEKSGSDYAVALYGVRLALPPEMNAKLAAKNVVSQAITLGVRPEHMSIALHSATGAISAKVDVSEMMGSEFYLHVNVGERAAVIRVPVMELPEQYRLGIGSCAEIHFSFSAEMAHLFSKESENNLLE
jgi:multiple sugar transport system ATP-binding protein